MHRQLIEQLFAVSWFFCIHTTVRQLQIKGLVVS